MQQDKKSFGKWKIEKVSDKLSLWPTRREKLIKTFPLFSMWRFLFELVMLTRNFSLSKFNFSAQSLNWCRRIQNILKWFHSFVGFHSRFNSSWRFDKSWREYHAVSCTLGNEVFMKFELKSKQQENNSSSFREQKRPRLQLMPQSSFFS